MLTRALAACALLVACHDDADPGFEIVRVPPSAYVMPDASASATRRPAPDGGAGPIVLCLPPPSDDDESDCADRYEGRAYDDRATARHRNKGEAGVCCYRRGRLPQPSGDDD